MVVYLILQVMVQYINKKGSHAWVTIYYPLKHENPKELFVKLPWDFTFIVEKDFLWINDFLPTICALTCIRLWFIITMLFVLSRLWLVIPCWWTCAIRIKIPQGIFRRMFSPVIQRLFS